MTPDKQTAFDQIEGLTSQLKVDMLLLVDALEHFEFPRTAVPHGARQLALRRALATDPIGYTTESSLVRAWGVLLSEGIVKREAPRWNG